MMNEKTNTDMKNNSQFITHNSQFKQTDIGRIPVDWEVKKLGEVCDIKKGQLITSDTKTDGIIPVIAGGKKPAYYHNKANRNGKHITVSGSGANAGYVSFHSYPFYASDCSTIGESSKYKIEYIYYLLLLFQEDIYNRQTGGAQPHIHPSDISPIEIPFPPLSEQTHIATILSDTDALITALEKRIAKKRLIKQGAMQTLLTPYLMVNGELLMVNGKPKMKDGWEVKKLGEVCDVLDNLRVPLNDSQ